MEQVIAVIVISLIAIFFATPYFCLGYLKDIANYLHGIREELEKINKRHGF